MEQLISIVIPVYNVQQYIETCLTTIIQQTYSNLQIILVDDGSTDDSGKICDNYAKQDTRIEVIHKANGGLSDARNVGIQNAKGKYIAFIDSDDFVAPDYIEILYKLIREYKADIAEANYKAVTTWKETKKDMSVPKIKAYNGKEIIRRIYEEETYVRTIVAWNKLYKMDLFKQVQYPYGKTHEDEFTTYKLLYASKNIITTTQELYYYRTNPNSIMHTTFKKNRLDIIEALEERMTFFRTKKEDELLALTQIRYQITLISHIIMCRLYLPKEKAKQKELVKKMRKQYIKVIRLKECSNKKKIKFTVAVISINLYRLLKKRYPKKEDKKGEEI